MDRGGRRRRASDRSPPLGNGSLRQGDGVAIYGWCRPEVLAKLADVRNLAPLVADRRNFCLPMWAPTDTPGDAMSVATDIELHKTAGQSAKSRSSSYKTVPVQNHQPPAAGPGAAVAQLASRAGSQSSTGSGQQQRCRVSGGDGCDEQAIEAWLAQVGVPPDGLDGRRARERPLLSGQVQLERTSVLWLRVEVGVLLPPVYLAHVTEILPEPLHGSSGYIANAWCRVSTVQPSGADRKNPDAERAEAAT